MTRKTIAHYLTDLATDLKITLDSEMSTAELTRCVERAVNDYSRFHPREMSKEITVDAEVTGESFTTPAASDPDYFVDDDDISAISDGDLPTRTAFIPDVPRPVLVTVTDADASITQLVVIVKGYDDDNKYIEEFFYLEGGLVQTGELYFAIVTVVEVDEVTGVGAADKLDVGTGAADGVYVKLVNKPVQFASETVTGGHTLNTDFEMDYSKGRIAMKSGGALTAGTAYTIAYTKSRIDIDLSKVIDEFIEIEKVEYPTGTVPQQFSSPEVWGNVLTLLGGHDTQSEMSDAEHAIIRYTIPHSPPNAQSSGSYPSHMDTTVQLAATAYALFIRALQYEEQAVTDHASVRTELGLTTSIHTLAAAALAKVTTYVADMDAALDKILVYLENNTNEDSKSWLTKITTDIAGLRTAFLTAADAGNAELDAGSFSDVATHLSSADAALVKVALYLETSDTTDNAKDVLSNITDDLAELRTKIIVAQDAIASELGLSGTNSLDKATTGAEGLLDTGDAFIDALNDGARVPENYREYAQARVLIAEARIGEANAYGQEIASRLANLRSYIEEASGWMQMGEVFIAEAAQEIAEADVIIRRENGISTQAAGYINEAVTRLDNLRTYIEQADAWGRIASGFAEEAAGRFSMCQAFIEEANIQVAEINSHVAEAQIYQTLADSNLVLADRFREEATVRRDEAWAIWLSPNQIAANYTTSKRGQPL